MKKNSKCLAKVYQLVYSHGMDMKKARLKNLLEILSKYDSQKSFALEKGINYRYLNQIKNGSKEIGERAARNLEKKIGLPVNALDKYTDNLEESISSEVHKMYSEAPENVKYAVSFLLSPPSNGKDFAKHITGAVNEFSNDDLFEDFDNSGSEIKSQSN